MSFLTRIFAARAERAALAPLYRAVVAAGRDPFWYRHGGVPDTLDGRFAMVSALIALVLLRMEAEEEARGPSVLLTELFIDDMDGTLRQAGVGDHLVGKEVGRMMSALGGRLAAFRDSGGDQEAFRAAVRRNVFRDAPPSEEAPALVAERLARFRIGLAATPRGNLLAGRVPAP
ncbi:MAG: ubiquinol-cytochrome C chaperone [Pseudomonadota bacterium]|nr:ubiquinol-cytochrome C chaperone [Pseudomonadota bacterium]